MQRTLSIIKPDAVARNITGKINAMLEEAGLRIIAQKRIKLSAEQARDFYIEHKDKGHFSDIVDFMSSGPCLVQVLEADNIIARYRDVIGVTDPLKAAEGTIRRLFGTSIGRNVIHGSDSVESAKREINFFFSETEIFQ